MALDVGELVARLTVDDTRFTRPLQQAERQLGDLERTTQQTAGRIGQAFRGSTDSVDRLGNAARGTSSDLERAGTQGARDIDRVRTSARQASDEVSRIGQAAGTAVTGMTRVGGAISSQAGHNAAGNFLSGFSDKLGDLASKTGPVAGSILGIAVLGLAAGAALAAAIQDGLSAELDRDMFQAKTATTEAQARKFAFAAGEAYADAFGESVEGNLNTLKLALQNNIIDPGATQRDAETVVAQLETISGALDGEVSESVKAVSALMSTGLATSAEEAADMIANAVGGSANKGEDLLEVITEYASGWKNAGINAETALALIEQSTDSGAWTADVAGDAMREWGRRISEEGDAVKEALSGMGFAADEMYGRLTAGNDDSVVAFDEMLDKLRGLETQQERNAAVAALLGDTSGDFYDVFTQWDPSEALKNFGEFEGAAGRLAGVMGGNAATSVEGAMRSVSMVADGMKATLAEAFGPQVAEWASSISNNRAGVVQFFLDVGNAVFDVSETILEFVASGMEGFGNLSGSAGDMVAGTLDSLASLVQGIDTVASAIPGLNLFVDGDSSDSIRDLADSVRSSGTTIGETMTAGADAIRNKLMPAVAEGRERFNQFGNEFKDSVAFNDESGKIAQAITEIGVAADGSALQLDGWTGAIDRANQPQVQMEDRIKGLVGALSEQTRIGLEAGVTVEELTKTYGNNRVALIDQLIATGMGNKAAVDYINTLGLTPELVETQIRQPGMPEAKSELDVLKGKVIDVPDDKSIHAKALTRDAIDDLNALDGVKVEVLKDGTVKVWAETDEANRNLQDWLQRERAMTVWVDIKKRRDAAGVPSDFVGPAIQDVAPQTNANGSIREYANGKLPDEAIIQPGRGKGLVQWAEGETGWEAFIPGAPSKRGRSTAILADVAKRFGFGLVKMENGGVFDGDAAASFFQAHNGEPYVYGGLDCSGLLSEGFNRATGQSVRFTTDSDFEAMGWVPGDDPDGFTIGTNKGSGPNGHMSGRLYGTPVESDGSNGIQWGGSADDPTTFPYVYHWPGASGGGNPTADQLAQADRMVEDALAAELSATGPSKADATKRRQMLEQQRDKLKGGAAGTTDSGVSLSTDGQRVFVTNWPSGASAELAASKPAPSPSGGGGGGGRGSAPAPATSFTAPPTPQQRLSDWAQQAGPDLAESWGIPKPGGVLGALLSPETGQAAAQTLAGITAQLQQLIDNPPVQEVYNVTDIDEALRKRDANRAAKTLTWTR